MPIPGLNIAAGITLVKTLMRMIDSLVSSKKERDELKAKVVEAINEYETNLSQELTRRLEIDTNSSKLARNIRPLTLIYLTILITILAFSDGNLGVITVKEIYVTKFIDAWWMAVLFYFGSRGVEKVLQIVGNRKK